jgi:hypothetical protein
MVNGCRCSACQGSGMKCGGDQQQIGPGMGKLGIGQGGVRPWEETKFNTIQKQAKVNTQAGSVIHTELNKGEQFKGEASKDLIDVATAAQHDVADALDQQKIPRPYQNSVRKYFERSQADIPVPEEKGKK